MNICDRLDAFLDQALRINPELRSITCGPANFNKLKQYLANNNIAVACFEDEKQRLLKVDKIYYNGIEIREKKGPDCSDP